MIAYSVSSGDYSDYSVIAIFECKEDAEAYIEAFAQENEYRVEEFDYYPRGYRPKIIVLWKAYTRYNDTTNNIRTHSVEEVDDDGSLTRRYQRPQVDGKPTSYVATCVDKEAAIKAIANRLTADEMKLLPANAVFDARRPPKK